MKLFIPRVGDKLEVLENWNCVIISESRNHDIFDAMGVQPDNNSHGTMITISIPKGTVLRVARLYVRAPASDFDTITFSVESSPLPGLEKCKFFAKVTEANKMECQRYYPPLKNIKKFKELFSAVANEMDFASQMMTSEEENIIFEKIIDNKSPYVVKLKIPRLHFAEHLAHQWGYRFSSNMNRDTAVVQELVKINAYLDEHKVPQALEFDVELHKALDYMLYRNPQGEVLNIFNDYAVKHYPEKSYYHNNNKIDLTNTSWKSHDFNKHSLVGFHYFNFTKDKNAKETATMVAPDGTEHEVNSFYDAYNKITKLEKSAKSTKTKKAKM